MKQVEIEHIPDTVVFEEQDVGFYILNSEGLVVLVALTDAVEPTPHTAALGLCRQQHSANNSKKKIISCFIMQR